MVWNTDSEMMKYHEMDPVQKNTPTAPLRLHANEPFSRSGLMKPEKANYVHENRKKWFSKEIARRISKSGRRIIKMNGERSIEHKLMKKKMQTLRARPQLQIERKNTRQSCTVRRAFLKRNDSTSRKLQNAEMVPQMAKKSVALLNDPFAPSPNDGSPSESLDCIQ